VARHIFQACPVWIYTQSNITVITSIISIIQLFQLRLSPEQSGKVEYERERLLGIANISFIY
jgi:putative exporter of polyketide antibiotics